MSLCHCVSKKNVRVFTPLVSLLWRAELAQRPPTRKLQSCNSSGMDATGRVGTTSPACAVEDILCQDDILSHVFASSCWLDPCWCFPYREPPPNQRPTPAIHLCLLLRLRLICHQWRAVIDEVAARPHTALDHSGCRRLAQWIERSMACVHMRMTL